MAQPPTPEGRIARVWDLPTRLVHWAIAAILPFSWWSITNDHLQWHRWAGYGLVGLLIFRLLWGIGGSETARFGRFIKGPAAILAYVRGRAPAPLGHSPLAALSVVAMLLALCLQVTLGLFAVDEDGLDPSPLAKFVSFETGRTIARLHHLNFYVLLGLVALHLIAIAAYALRGKNLVGPLITGRRRLPAVFAAAQFAPAWFAVLTAAIAAALAWFLAHGAKF